MTIEMIKVPELAALLDMNLKTVYAALDDGEIPGAVKVRGRYRINKATVLAWLSSGQEPRRKAKR